MRVEGIRTLRRSSDHNHHGISYAGGTPFFTARKVDQYVDKCCVSWLGITLWEFSSHRRACLVTNSLIIINIWKLLSETHKTATPMWVYINTRVPQYSVKPFKAILDDAQLFNEYLLVTSIAKAGVSNFVVSNVSVTDRTSRESIQPTYKQSKTFHALKCRRISHALGADNRDWNFAHRGSLLNTVIRWLIYRKTRCG